MAQCLCTQLFLPMKRLYLAGDILLGVSGCLKPCAARKKCSHAPGLPTRILLLGQEKLSGPCVPGARYGIWPAIGRGQKISRAEPGTRERGNCGGAQGRLAQGVP